MGYMQRFGHLAAHTTWHCSTKRGYTTSALVRTESEVGMRTSLLRSVELIVGSTGAWRTDTISDYI